jgi:DnaK suppressor protein
MKAGTYGVCEITSKPIPLARLQALPYATTTIEAQREMEKLGVRDPADYSRILGGSDNDLLMNDMEVS